LSIPTWPSVKARVPLAPEIILQTALNVKTVQLRAKAWYRKLFSPLTFFVRLASAVTADWHLSHQVMME